jgi:hypothetical protein
MLLKTGLGSPIRGKKWNISDLVGRGQITTSLKPCLRQGLLLIFGQTGIATLSSMTGLSSRLSWVSSCQS